MKILVALDNKEIKEKIDEIYIKMYMNMILLQRKM